MGLLAKTNPAATRESVIRNAVLFGVLSGLAYVVASVWQQEMRDNCLILFPLAVIAGAALGGLMEWQLDAPDAYEVLLEVEEEFGVTLPKKDLMKVETSVGDIFDVLITALRFQHPDRFGEGSADSEAIWQRLKARLVRQLGVDATEIVPSARFGFELV